MSTYSLINDGDSGLSVRTTLNELLQDANDGVFVGPAGSSGSSGSSGQDGSSGSSGSSGVSGSNSLIYDEESQKIYTVNNPGGGTNSIVIGTFSDASTLSKLTNTVLIGGSFSAQPGFVDPNSDNTIIGYDIATYGKNNIAIGTKLRNAGGEGGMEEINIGFNNVVGQRNGINIGNGNTNVGYFGIGIGSGIFQQGGVNHCIAIGNSTGHEINSAQNTTLGHVNFYVNQYKFGSTLLGRFNLGSEIAYSFIFGAFGSTNDLAYADIIFNNAKSYGSTGSIFMNSNRTGGGFTHSASSVYINTADYYLDRPNINVGPNTDRITAISSYSSKIEGGASYSTIINADDVTIKATASYVSIINRSGFTASNNNTLYTDKLDATLYSINDTEGWSGTYSTGDGRVVTVTGGIITDVA